MIIKMSKHYTTQLVNFLYEHNQRKDYFIAWIPESRTELTDLNKSSFLLCIENNTIVGCLGAYISIEQRCARLLGPIIEKEYFDAYADQLLCSLLDVLPKEVNELRIAFLDENTLCRQWCKDQAFELYNAEITMVFHDDELTAHQKVSKAELIFYEPRFMDGLARVHPENTFFTLNELISQISDRHHLLLAVSEGEVVGYVYYERTEDLKSGEIQLLHIKESFRSMGLGSQLLITAIQDLKNDCVQQITTSVRTANEKAHKLYLRMGFIDKETIYAYKKML